MCSARSEQFEKERILSVVFDQGLGLCVELGDEKLDEGVYGYGPTQDFIRAVAREISFQIRNTGDIEEHPTLRKVQRRLRQGQEKSYSQRPQC